MYALSIDVKYGILPEHGHIVQQTYFNSIYLWDVCLSLFECRSFFSPSALLLFAVLNICSIDNGKGCNSFL